MSLQKGHSTCLETIKNNLHKVPFNAFEEYSVETTQEWDVPMIINLFYSGTGFLEWLGNDKAKFEQKIHQALTTLNPRGTFESITQFGITFCIK